MNGSLFPIAVVIGIISYLVVRFLKTEMYTIITSNLNKADERLMNSFGFNEKRENLAFDQAEKWRVNKVAEIYADVSDDELDNAGRWINYANPFADFRSCLSTSNVWSKLVDLESMWDKLQIVTVPEFVWNETCRKGMLALHSFHTTGIEGNTLNLSETLLVVNDRHLEILTPTTFHSVQEARNIQSILNTLQLANPPTPSNLPYIFTKQLLVDINSAILGNASGTGTFRTHPVAIGHQNIVLPMPDEVNHLVDLYIDWINKEMDVFRSKLHEDISPEDILVMMLSLACDAHTRFVHIHPFSDGNGRLARILSGLVLRSVLLPAPLFLKEERIEYVNAVGTNTISGDSTVLCKMHVDAVHQSIDAMIQLSKNGCHLMTTDN